MSNLSIGPAVIDRAWYRAFHDGENPVSTIEASNPCNGTGIIDTVYLWLAIPDIDNFRIFTAYYDGGPRVNLEPNILSSRDYVDLGPVGAGEIKTFTGLNLSVSTGDFIGISGSIGGGYIEADLTGGVGYWFWGPNAPFVNQEILWYEGGIISVAGTGTGDVPLAIGAVLPLGIPLIK